MDVFKELGDYGKYFFYFMVIGAIIGNSNKIINFVKKVISWIDSKKSLKKCPRCKKRSMHFAETKTAIRDGLQSKYARYGCADCGESKNIWL